MRVLYICPDGILDNLGQTQVLPYIYGLNKKSYKFIILSFEKHDRKKEELLEQELILKKKNIIWYHLPFYPGRHHRLLRFIFGPIKINLIFKKHKIGLIHLRAINAGALFLFSRIKCPYIFDIRAFAGQLVDYGLLKNSWLSKFFIYLEKILINNSRGIVVLDKSGFNYLKSNFKLNSHIEIIPTATNTKRFNLIKKDNVNSQKKIKFVLLGGANFPYLTKKALLFLEILLKNKVDCNLDIINKGDHEYIKEIINEINFPMSKVKIFSIKPKDIYKVLPNYDCGLVFIKTGNWIKMSSPTKIGEYLAAGLHVIGLEGIEVLERLSKETKCVDVLPENLNHKNFDVYKIESLIKKIKDKNRKKNSSNIAKKYFDIDNALEKYLKLYKNINK